MCGRYTQHHSVDDIVNLFSITEVDVEPAQRFNIAPTQQVAVVTTDTEGTRALDSFRWGLIPFWAKDPGIGSKMINARTETVAEKPAFKRLLSRRRCVIPADGFYEWQTIADGKGKQPVHFHLREGALFGFAGLWDEWQQPDGEPLRTCTILTTAANALVAPVHDRMPVILPRGEVTDHWLDTTVTEADDLLPLLRPYSAEAMVAVPVSRRVNVVANDDPRLIEPEGHR